MLTYAVDARREVTIPGDTAATLQFCASHWIRCYHEAVQSHGGFFVALSGGSTPKALFSLLTSPKWASQINWSLVHLFWSDERSVPLDHLDSNYHMAMQAGLLQMPIPPSQIHPMITQGDIEQRAQEYEQLLQATGQLDLVMLGMGEDGHTASLFPGQEEPTLEKLVIAQYVLAKQSWRMSLTFTCINQARHIALYVLGSSKKDMVQKALQKEPLIYPVQKVGSSSHKALWILDEEAADLLKRT